MEIIGRRAPHLYLIPLAKLTKVKQIRNLCSVQMIKRQKEKGEGLELTNSMN
jgi:hypothetical protein